jgi:hypothetical protein
VEFGKVRVEKRLAKLWKRVSGVVCHFVATARRSIAVGAIVLGCWSRAFGDCVHTGRSSTVIINPADSTPGNP